MKNPVFGKTMENEIKLRVLSLLQQKEEGII